MSPHERESRLRAAREAEGRERRLVAVGLVLLGLVVVAAFAFMSGRSTAAREAQNADALALEPPAPDPWARPTTGSGAASTSAAPVASATTYRREEWPRDAPAASARPGVAVKGYVRKDGTYVRPHVRSRPSR